MKKHLISRLFAMLCVAFCLINASGLFAQSQRGMKITIQPKEGKAIPLYKDSYALVVGNGNYTEGWSRLPGALQDVDEVTDALKEHGFFVTLKKDLTKQEFERAFANFVGNAGREPYNRLLFYYAGHGYTQKMATGEDLGYLVMVDAPLPEKEAINFKLKAADMAWLTTQAKLILSRHVLFVFDSCFAGTILDLRARTIPEHISDRVKHPVRQFITAGRANEQVPDYSVFKQEFLDLIQGRVEDPVSDGYITGEELGNHLSTEVPKYNNGAQHPQHGKIMDPRLNKGDFVFVLPNSESPTVATLTVTSTPSGADIYVDNAWIGKTPLTKNYKVATGSRREKQVTVHLELSGYKNSRVVLLTLKGGKKTPWDVRLERFIPRIGTLMVTSVPSGASVYIDNDFIGQTPLRDYGIDTGGTREKQIGIRLELSGYKSRVVQLTLRGGQRTPWDVRLEKIPQIQEASVPSDTSTEGMVFIPAGKFQMGSNKGNFDEKPVHTVYVDAFYMDAYEVTNAQYKEFVDSNPQWGKDQIPSKYHDGNYLKHWTGNSHGRGDHPVVYVSWYAAMAYAEWADKRLPTEAEWERAARGGLAGKKYPWGDSINSSNAAYNVGGTADVGTYLPNNYGLYDMAGNVWEWCLDEYQEDYYKISPLRNPIARMNSLTNITSNFTNIKDKRVLRGGSWTSNPRSLRVADRRGNFPTFTNSYFGFRCARNAP